MANSQQKNHPNERMNTTTVARDGVAGETAWASGEGPGGVFASGDVGDVDDPTDARRARARDDRPPPPQFFDLNGDGVREMLVAAGGGASAASWRRTRCGTCSTSWTRWTATTRPRWA